MTFKERIFLWLVPYPQWSWYVASALAATCIVGFWYCTAPDITFLLRLLDVSSGTSPFTASMDSSDFFYAPVSPPVRTAQTCNSIAAVVVEAARTTGATIEQLSRDGGAQNEGVSHGEISPYGADARMRSSVRYVVSGTLQQLLEITRLCSVCSDIIIHEIRMMRVNDKGIVRLEMVCMPVDA